MLEIESRAVGFLPGAFLIALLAATPFSRREAAGAFACGLGAAMLPFGLRVFLATLLLADKVGAHPLSTGWRDGLLRIEDLVVVRPTSSFVAAAGFWIAIVAVMRRARRFGRSLA